MGNGAELSQRERTGAAVRIAKRSIEGMPMHFRAAVGPYVEPVMLAMLEIDAELAALRVEFINQGRGEHGN